MWQNAIIKSLVVMAAVSLFGCTTAKMSENKPMGMDTQLSEIADREAKVAADERRLADITEMETMVKKEQARVRELEKKLAMQKSKMNSQIPSESKAGYEMGSNELLPPKAKVGECYARVFVPSTYNFITEKKLKKAASNRIKIIPARYETVKEKVLKKAESERMEIIPAEYKWVQEQMLVKPEHRKLIDVPAVYETVTEKVLVREAHMEWKKGKGPIQRINEGTGEIMCLVEDPAIYKTITKKVLKTAAKTEEKTIPAVYRTVKRQVMTRAPQTRTIPIPAEYGYVNVTRLVEPEKEIRVAVPEEFQTVTKKVKVSDGRMEWKEILCETNMTRNRIVDIQKELKKEGFDPGPVDGIIGMDTMGAVNEFQKKKGLLVSKYVTIETVKALGISPR